MSNKITVVIPTLNEENGIEETISSIPLAELKNIGYKAQVLVVDGNSTDKTRELAEKTGAEVIIEPVRGYGRAFKTGFTNATGDIIVTLDADATYPAEDIPRLIRILEEKNLDFITTNRFALMEKGAMTFLNRVGNTILALEIMGLFGLKLRDPESGMFIFRRGIVDNLKLGSDTWPFSHEIKIEACYFNKYRWMEVPIKYRPRQGDTKLVNVWKIGFTDLFHIIIKRFVR